MIIGRIRDSHLLRNDVKARHDKMVELVERMLDLHAPTAAIAVYQRRWRGAVPQHSWYVSESHRGRKEHTSCQDERVTYRFRED